MFLIIPPKEDTPSLRQEQESAVAAAGNEDQPEEIRSRVRKACNRCRLRKVKCNGRIPCTRCERDHATCKIDSNMVGLKNLSRSYIASLEEQQISLLSALRELRRQAPNDRVVCDTIDQLQRKGFDIDSLKFKDQHTDLSQSEARTEQSETVRPTSISWDYNQISMDDIQSLLQQPATPQAVSDLLWHFGDVANQDLIQSQTQSMPLQVDNSYPGPAFQENIESTMEPIFQRPE
ncbi:hypothetical protein AA0119_g11786 [Alternaria tenuissima]|uniref:Zn(2)-C6 fungal-type domain-containing protein n=1 Tax=Alternaria tenuissima TaxID=119927 RepID=A0ABY0FT83_9PLEO|nr:hypothetical protein AA0118_g10382 [Alternaria tenuissima]RYN88518.1 hypothetical protein AA0119_g11786 [Alternaria tenuissima]RYO01202.1 hypothetical protein AA0121_g13265 [Alternaria tenuissima]